MRSQAHFVLSLLGFAVFAFASTSSHAKDARSSASQVALVEFKRAIRAQYDSKEKAFSAGDIESLVTHFYAPDAIAAGEGEAHTTVGLAEFRKGYIAYRKSVASLHIESVHSVVSGDSGWDWANIREMPASSGGESGKSSMLRILFLWSKEDGRWKCKGEVYLNGEFPPALFPPKA